MVIVFFCESKIWQLLMKTYHDEGLLTVMKINPNLIQDVAIMFLTMSGFLFTLNIFKFVKRLKLIPIQTFSPDVKYYKPKHALKVPCSELFFFFNMK